jgi:hypothetical protein
MVEGARAEIGSDSELVARALLRRLRALTPEDIKQFQQLWEQARDDVYRWPISDAATLLLGPSTDYDFPAVQDWIVSHGRRTVRQVSDDPDSLVALAPDRHNVKIDWFGDLALEAYIAATGVPFTIDEPPGLEEPLGAEVDLTDEASARRHFPRLTAYLDDNPWMWRPWERPDD